MSYKIPPYIPIETALVDDIRFKKLVRYMPNCTGIGIFFGIILNIIKNESLAYSYADIDVLADEIKTNIPQVLEVVEKSGLFQIFQDENGKKFFSPILNNSLIPYFEKCENNRINAKIGAQKRKIQKENQLKELKQLSQLDSSERPLGGRSANRIEYNIRKEKEEENEKWEELKNKLLNNQIAKDKQKERYENLAQANIDNMVIDI